MFMHFRSIQKILSNWSKIRKSIELHLKAIDMVRKMVTLFTRMIIQTDCISLLVLFEI